MRTFGTIEIDGNTYDVLNAYSCGPGERPHTFDVYTLNGSATASEVAGVWTFTPRYGYPRVVRVVTSGYRPPHVEARAA